MQMPQDVAVKKGARVIATSNGPVITGETIERHGEEETAVCVWSVRNNGYRFPFFISTLRLAEPE